MLKRIILFFFCLLISLSTSSQSELGNKELYKWFDASVGQENIGLIDGVEYRELYHSKDGDHKFYASSSYQIGNVTYNGQQYFDVEMKYDLHDDEIIIKTPTRTITHTIQLIKEKIDSFSINGAEFIALNNLTDHINGFYEVLFRSEDLSFYKKNIKSSNKYYSGRSIYYRFKNKDEYLLYFNDEYHKITKSKKSLIKLLPEHKKDINLFYKSESELLKINYGLFMKKLLIELNTTISKQQR